MNMESGRGKHSKILIGMMMMVKVVVVVAAATVTPVVGLLAHSDDASQAKEG